MARKRPKSAVEKAAEGVEEMWWDVGDWMRSFRHRETLKRIARWLAAIRFKLEA